LEKLDILIRQAETEREFDWLLKVNPMKIPRWRCLWLRIVITGNIAQLIRVALAEA
jgi:hypothetical protein